ncbi:MAG: hypothetical protein AB7P03_17480 [Kofleriaceae bacterium]
MKPTRPAAKQQEVLPHTVQRIVIDSVESSFEFLGDDDGSVVKDDGPFARDPGKFAKNTVATLADEVAALLRRVFGDDVTHCSRCGDHLRVLAFLTDPAVTARILDHLGVRPEVPPVSPARAPPDAQPDLDVGC